MNIEPPLQIDQICNKKDNHLRVQEGWFFWLLTVLLFIEHLFIIKSISLCLYSDSLWRVSGLVDFVPPKGSAFIDERASANLSPVINQPFWSQSWAGTLVQSFIYMLSVVAFVLPMLDWSSCDREPRKLLQIRYLLVVLQASLLNPDIERNHRTISLIKFLF